MAVVATSGFLFKHRKKIIAVVIIVFLWLAFLIDQEEAELCGPGQGSGGGAAGVVNSDGLAYPTDPDATTFTSGFGIRDGVPHNGVDLAGPIGTPIYAFADGKVIAAADSGVGGFGGWVVISHQIDGKEMSTVSGHMDPGGVMVSEGDQVKAGQQIARIGNSGMSSGPHLHFELYNGNRLEGGQPFDPKPTLDEVLANGGSATAPGGGNDDNTDDDKDADKDDTKDSGSTAPEADQDGPVEDLRARQIIDAGQQRDADEKTIIAALSAGIVESGMRNLASEAVPESKNFPNDGVAPGDYDSVGLFQQRASIWADQAGGIGGLMDPAQQAKWFYDTAETTSGSTPGELAANVERPAEQYRGKYAQVEDEARDYYARLADGASGALGASAGQCGSTGKPGDGVPGDAHGVGRAILAAAREQFGQPYVWGGGDHHGPTNGGFDCSGFTMYAVYQATNGEVALGHQTNVQVSDPQLEEVSWEDRQPGDLLFFGSPGDYYHVSIYSGEKDGTPMHYEAQQTGVDSGEYSVPGGKADAVRRVKTADPGDVADAEDKASQDKEE